MVVTYHLSRELHYARHALFFFFPSNHFDTHPLNDNIIAPASILEKTFYVKVIEVPALLFVAEIERHQEVFFLALTLGVPTESPISHDALAFADVW